MHLYIVSGILLIVPIVNFALAAPVQVQEKRRACPDTDMADIPEYTITVLGKRGGEIEEVGNEILRVEDWFKAPESSAAPLTESARLLTGEPLLSSVHSEWFHPDNKFLEAHGPPPNTGPPNPFHPDNKFLEAHGPQLNTGPPNPAKELEMVDTRPPGPGPSTDPNRE